MSKRLLRTRDEVLGKEFETNKCGKCVVVDYKGAYDVLVKFENSNVIVSCQLDNLRKGKVLNPFHPTFEGVGYIGVGKYSSADTKLYNLWKNMLERAYNTRSHAKRPTYKDTTVCKEWLNFQNFAEWCLNQKFFGLRDSDGASYHLDKDLLVKGNKVYSPETCCFIPPSINSLLITARRIRGEYPVGVHYIEKIGLYSASLRCYGVQKTLGYFNTYAYAFEEYKKAKESHIKDVAEKWKGKIDEKAYQALLGWEISMED